jgi:hypothetical protein
VWWGHMWFTTPGSVGTGMMPLHMKHKWQCLNPWGSDRSCGHGRLTLTLRTKSARTTMPLHLRLARAKCASDLVSVRQPKILHATSSGMSSIIHRTLCPALNCPTAVRRVHRRPVCHGKQVLALRAAEALLAHPVAPLILYNLLGANCECFATWCRTGRCEPDPDRLLRDVAMPAHAPPRSFK